MTKPYAKKNPYGDRLSPFVNLNPAHFNELIAKHGIRVKIEKTVVCPNYEGNVKEGRHDVNCELCENGFIHFAEVEVYGVFQQNALSKMYLERGEFVPGQAFLTIPSEAEKTASDISALTVAQNATIVSPAIPFLSGGTSEGVFTAGSKTGLKQGDTISVEDDDTTAFSVKILTISGSASPYTITVTDTESDAIVVGLYDRITLLDQSERFYELHNKSAPEVVDLADYTVLKNAKSVSPEIPFLSDGTSLGVFTTGSVSGLSVGDLVTLTDDDSDDIEVQIQSLSGSASPYTITVKTENNSDILRYNATEVEFITTASRGVNNPFVEGTDFSLDSNFNLQWILGGDRPSYDPNIGLGEAFSVSYQFRPVYRVLQAIHEGRYSQEYSSAGRNTTRFPQMFLIRKDYYVDKRDVTGVFIKPDPIDQTDNDDPNEPTSGGW